MRLYGCALLVGAGVLITLIILGQKAFSFEFLLWFCVLAMPMICTLNMKHRSAGIFTTASFILSALIGLWAHWLALLVCLYSVCLFMGGYIGLSLKLRTAK